MLTSELRDKDDRQRTPVAHKGQRGSRLPYIACSAEPRRAREQQMNRPARPPAAAAPRYAFVTARRRELSRDLGAEMILIMRPDKLALCRVLSITRRIRHERTRDATGTCPRDYLLG